MDVRPGETSNPTILVEALLMVTCYWLVVRVVRLCETYTLLFILKKL